MSEEIQYHYVKGKGWVPHRGYLPGFIITPEMCDGEWISLFDDYPAYKFPPICSGWIKFPRIGYRDLRVGDIIPYSTPSIVVIIDMIDTYHANCSHIYPKSLNYLRQPNDDHYRRTLADFICVVRPPQ